MATLLDWFLDAMPAILGMAAVIGAASLLLAAWRARSGGWSSALSTTVADAVLLVALGGIAVLTLGDPMGPQPDRINLIPFRDQWWALQGLVDPNLATATLVANVVLFVPLGAALAARFPAASTWSLVLLAAGVSLAVEAAQALLDIGRLADVTDLLTNTAGAAIGVVMWDAVSTDDSQNERSA